MREFAITDESTLHSNHFCRYLRFLAANCQIYQRRGRDSNPGSSYPDSGFQDQCNRPLCHLSEHPPSSYAEKTSVGPYSTVGIASSQRSLRTRRYSVPPKNLPQSIVAGQPDRRDSDRHLRRHAIRSVGISARQPPRGQRVAMAKARPGTPRAATAKPLRCIAAQASDTPCIFVMRSLYSAKAAQTSFLPCLTPFRTAHADPA